jgi:hypothetical protein
VPGDVRFVDRPDDRRLVGVVHHVVGADGPVGVLEDLDAALVGRLGDVDDVPVDVPGAAVGARVVAGVCGALVHGVRVRECRRPT